MKITISFDTDHESFARLGFPEACANALEFARSNIVQEWLIGGVRDGKRVSVRDKATGQRSVSIEFGGEGGA